MLIGLLYEGKRDESAISSLIKRILEDCVKEDLRFIQYKAEGPIINKINPALKTFFGLKESAEIAVFFSDQDKDPNHCKNLEIKTREELATHYSGRKVVFAFPSPHFENWFIVEENSLKELYELERGEKLPFSEIKYPKSRLERIHETANIEMLTITKAYTKLAEGIDIKLLKDKDRDFKRLHNELREAAGCEVYQSTF